MPKTERSNRSLKPGGTYGPRPKNKKRRSKKPVKKRVALNEVIVKLEHISKHYAIRSEKLFEAPRILKAVDGLSLEIRRGETFGIVGESGCGKSTMGHMIVHLLEPTSGKVTYSAYPSGVPSSEMRAFREKYQIIFQDPYSSLNPKKRIGWLLTEPLNIHSIGTTPAVRRSIAERMLQEVGMDISCMEKYPNELSGGQRQRVAIAIAMITDPEFVVADEPVSALDVSIQAQILNLMKELQAARGLTWLFISHDLNVVHYISDRIGVMYMGKLVEVGNVEAVYSEPMHPYTRALLSSVPTIDGPEKEDDVLEGEVKNTADRGSGCAFAPRCRYATEQCFRETPVLTKVGDRRVSCLRSGMI